MSKPILFNSDMVRAVLDGRKTQTRRVMNEKFLVKMKAAALFGEASDFVGNGELRPNDESYILEFCPYGKIGDKLYLKEGYQILNKPIGHMVHGFYKRDREVFDVELTEKEFEKWSKRKKPYAMTSKLFMYKSLAREFFEITNIRVERVNEITEGGAIAEGVVGLESVEDAVYLTASEGRTRCTYIDKFRWLWDSINAKRGYGWEKNCWVWVVEFRRIDK